MSSDNDHASPQGQEGPQGTQPSSALGIRVAEEDGQVVVERVDPNGPSEGKLRQGDVVQEVNHQPVTSSNDLATKVRATPGDKPVLLRVKRGDQARYVAIERGGAR